MALEFLDYDPVTGLEEYVEWGDGGKSFRIVSKQEVSHYIDYAKELANSGATERNFRGEGWLYAMIPAVVQAQMFQRGINFLDKNNAKKVVDVINADYPWLKTTHRHHALKR